MSYTLAQAKRQHRRKRASAVRVTDKIRMGGGLNLVDSAEQIPAGELLVNKNYEPHFISQAYARVEGYEVYDGQPRPHLAEYWKVELTDIDLGPYEVGETVTALAPDLNTETGIVALYYVSDAGDNSGYIIVTDLTNDVDEGSVWTGSTSGAFGDGGSSDFQGEEDEDLHDAAQLAAELLRREVITTVGDAASSGKVTGVHVYNDNVYGFRNNAAGTAADMWKATSSGWEQIDLGYKIRFTAGTTAPLVGDTITGATSSASFEVKRVVVTVGLWAGDDAEGYFITDAVTAGPLTAAEDLQLVGNTIATYDSTEAQTLPIDGKYRFRNYNYGGNTSSFAMYGCNGVGNAFEFDGTTFTLIETGMSPDTPNHVGVHRGQLLLSYTGGSLQHSAKNNPLSWQPINGANELLAGDEVQGFIEEVGDVSFVYTRNKTYRLEGFVQENIQLKLHNSETGAIANSIQRIGKSVYLDDRGFSTLPTTDTFGDFASSAISMKVDPLVQSFLKNSTIQDSVVHRGKSVYRCFFSNHEAIVIGFSGNKVNGITTIDYDLNVTATSNGEIEDAGTNNGVERVFIGSDDGYIYETDVGRNFNGEEIEAYLVTAYHFSGTPEISKRYRRATIYMEGNGRVTMKVSADYDYNEDPLNFETILEGAVPLGGGRYGISRHGAFVYSAASKTDIRVPMNSHARNVSMIFYHRQANEETHTVFAIHYHLSGRRIIRS